MGPLIAWFYHRYRARVLVPLSVVLMLFLWGISGITMGVFKRVAPLSWGEFWGMWGAIAAVESIFFLVGLTYFLRRYPIVLRWLRDGPLPDEAEEGWTVGVRLPGAVLRTGLSFLLGPTLACGVVGALIVEESSVALLAFIVLGFLTAAGYAAAWVHLLGTVMVRPALEEGSEFLRADFVPPSADVTGRGIIAALVGLVYMAGVLVAGYSVEPGTGVEDALWVFVAGAGVALVFGIPLGVLFAERIVGPTRTLTDGVQSVASGDLTARVPLISDDHHGRLSAAFNSMVAALAEATEGLRASRARIVAVGDAERRRLERDIHDGAQQRLVMLQLKAGQIARGVDHEATLAQLEELKKDVKTALEELRDLAHGIYPAVLESDGLPGALAEAAQRAAIPTTLDSDGAGRYPPEIEAAVYFCCLEALQNAAKYAGKGAKATVRLEAADGSLLFAVSDDGAGFDAAAVDGNHGLQNMTDRIGALGGTLRVESAPGQGTRVEGRVSVT